MCLEYKDVSGGLSNEELDKEIARLKIEVIINLFDS